MTSRSPSVLHRASPLQLWFAFLGAITAWAVHIGARYPLVPIACKNDATVLLHAVSAGCLLAAVGAGLVAFRLHRRTRHAGESSHATAVRRLNFMALSGIAFSALFSAIIIAELLPALLQDPCIGVRTR